MTGSVYRPLKGVKVLCFEIAYALPAGTRALWELGADVVRVARPGGNPVARYSGVVDGVFQGKSCVAIDLTTAAGRNLALELALQADVVCNNFRPGVIDKFGLGAQALRTAKPELIWLQMSGYGTPGPWSEFPAYGPSTEAAGGMNRLMVGEGEVPIRIGSGVFADQLSGRYAALAVVAAIMKRAKSGEGATIDLSMSACITHMLGSLMVAAARTGRTPEPDRNRSAGYAPQGVYPAAGTDEWIAISVGSDAQWRRLVEAVGGEGLDASLDLPGRQRHHDQIDAILGEWTHRHEKNQLADRLQSLGIAAAPVRTAADANLDPQLRARGALQLIRHRQPLLGYGAHPHPRLPWRIVGRRRRALTDYRNAGQDNRAVLRRWLRLEPDAVRELERQQVLIDEGPTVIAEPPQVEALRDPDFASRLELPR